jgi:hypothetical protein
MNITQLLKRLEQTKKVLKAVSGLVVVAIGMKDILNRSLPSLKIPRLHGRSQTDDIGKLYNQVVDELKLERAAHEETREYLRWAIREIENVKKAMRDWQKKALTKARPKRRRLQHNS